MLYVMIDALVLVVPELSQDCRKGEPLVTHLFQSAVACSGLLRTDNWGDISATSNSIYRIFLK